MSVERHRDVLRARRLKTCRHFTGVQNETCEAGVGYSKFPPTRGRGRALPCFGDQGVSCEKFEARSEAEVDAEEQQRAILAANFIKAREAIVAATGGARSTEGTLPCPACGTGTRSYTVASNGHIWSACTTDTCVRWME